MVFFNTQSVSPHARIVPLASAGLAIPEAWNRARSFPRARHPRNPSPDPIPSLAKVGRVHLGKLHWARAQPVLRREVLHDDSGELGAQTQHLGAEALAHASVEAVRVDLAAPWHRKCRHARLDRHGWHRAASNRHEIE
eukprot:3069105-Prymnesium_polylepis.2